MKISSAKMSMFCQIADCCLPVVDTLERIIYAMSNMRQLATWHSFITIDGPLSAQQWNVRNYFALWHFYDFKMLVVMRRCPSAEHTTTRGMSPKTLLFFSFSIISSRVEYLQRVFIN